MNRKRLSGDSLQKPSSLREQISTALRAALITGEMLPGETYSVPAIAETLPGYEAGLFIGMAAPAATPRDITTRLHGEIARIMQLPDIRTRLAQLGDEIAVSTSPEQFTAFIRTEFAKWDRVIREAGIKVE